MSLTDEDALSKLMEHVYSSEIIENWNGSESNIKIEENIFHIYKNGEPHLLIGFTHKNNRMEMMEEIKKVATKLPTVKELLLFYTGGGNSFLEHNKTPKINIIPIELSWIFYQGIHQGDDSELSYYVWKRCAEELKSRIQNLKSGDGREYERLLKGVFRFSFPTCIFRITSQSHTAGSHQIRDLLLKIKENSNLCRYIQRSNRTSTTIIVEAKNQSTNKGSSIHQLEGYLGEGRAADIGILVTRSPLKKNLLNLAMTGQRNRSQSALIIPISDKDIFTILNKAAEGDFLNCENELINWIDHAIENRP